MKSIRIGNDIRIEWPIVLSGDVSKLQDLDLTVEVRPSAKIIDTHNYADEIRNNDNKRLLFEKHETTVMMNGGLECRRDIGDGKEHCRPRPPRPCPPRPIPPAPVKLPYHIEDNTLIAMWTADRQFATGDYDIILYAHKNEGGQAVCDQYRFVRLVSHTAQADAPDDSGIEAVIAMQPVTLELSGLSAYEVAVINGFQGTEEEWLASLKKPAEDAAEELKQEIEQFKEDTKEELQADIKALGYYEDNPEFIRAYTDAEGKFLWGIRVDGSIEWAKGVPTPVQNALKELADKIKDLGGDKIEEVETALNEKIEALQDAIDVINASLKTLTDTFSYQDNPEFVNVVTDAEGKVLFGIKEDGKPYFPKNETYSVESNQEFLAAWLDSAGHVLFGLRQDGSTYVAKADFLDKIEEIRQLLEDNGIGDDELKQRVEALEDTFSHQENEEFAYVVTDNEGKVLEATQADGKKYFPKQALLDKYDDVEGRTEITLDAENKVLAYRDKEGIKHEEKLALNEVYDKDNNKINLATKEDVKNVTVDPSSINISELKGVSDHNTPNLLIPSEMQKTFNDGTNSFTPPNEGYEMSNPIECQAGDWFTRTGTATGMVVVTDENDKNGTRLFNADGTTLANTFQIPTDMTWVRYVRMAALRSGAEDGSVVICKGKEAYTGNNRGDFLTVDNLRVQAFNLPKDLKYLKSSDGKYWELYVDNSHVLQIREIDPDIITELPSDWIEFVEVRGDFSDFADRIDIKNNLFLIEIQKNGGVVKYLPFTQYGLSESYANFEHFYTSSSEDRYVVTFTNRAANQLKGLTIFDGDFNVISTGIGINNDPHDFCYISDDDVIIFANITNEVSIPGDTQDKRSIIGTLISEYKKIHGVWQVVGTFNSNDYPRLATDALGDLSTDAISSHQNTLKLDYDGNLLLNLRNYNSFIKIKRSVNDDGTITIGSKTLDYNEAIIGRVGGHHNSGYIDDKRVLNDGFSFTDSPASLIDISSDICEEWQFFGEHDTSYWGMKEIEGENYPTYTIFDNNRWTGSAGTNNYNIRNQRNNISINPNGNEDYSYNRTKGTSDENYKKYMLSRVVQLSIDWDNHLIKDYRVYILPEMYSAEMGSVKMLDEGVLCISYSNSFKIGIWDFTTEETDISGHIYTNAKEVFYLDNTGGGNLYRANPYKINN